MVGRWQGASNGRTILSSSLIYSLSGAYLLQSKYTILHNQRDNVNFENCDQDHLFCVQDIYLRRVLYSKNHFARSKDPYFVTHQERGLFLPMGCCKRIVVAENEQWVLIYCNPKTFVKCSTTRRLFKMGNII